MKLFISGICGTGMGPLALMAKNAGFGVCGSDLAAGQILPELKKAGIPTEIGAQDGEYLRRSGAEWFVHTSALPDDAPELQTARELGLKISKRDVLIAELVKKLGLKMVAIAGTHGKTTTTGLVIWAARQLKLPVSYLIGTTLGFAPSGHYQPDSQYLIYEADEYDRNFLHFHTWLGVITVATYDHPDVYPTPEDYQAAFAQFAAQSEGVIRGGAEDARISLSGALRRQDATLALEIIKRIAADSGADVPEERIITALNTFPGVGRRFERLSPGVFSDYAHHPEEIAATLKMAQEEAARSGFKGVVAMYEPHQNVRQHRVKEGYHSAFQGASRVFWLPTYLTREDPDLPVITPKEFVAALDNPKIAEPAAPNDALAGTLKRLRAEGYLILLMTAGPADLWLREVFADEKAPTQVKA